MDLRLLVETTNLYNECKRLISLYENYTYTSEKPEVIKAEKRMEELTDRIKKFNIDDIEKLDINSRSQALRNYADELNSIHIQMKELSLFLDKEYNRVEV